ncbi:cysteine desulfurase family protein [Leucobacter denitrificans]|uniref:Cysteine desulfurase n=1 Tax=Leucobacter denitrificans TaxID=683042 RepID=A0A7G9S7H4_9MICO|nr:cysteine desulfurase family protein [Leucobacter denitrificans]QNN63799.1 cysteine desulfurase [Leucobacter denitrificans]
MRSYLDHAATSPMSESVLSKYVGALRTVGNPASTHGNGQHASELLEAARERVAQSLGCDSAELVFTGGGTESINLALKGVYWARQRGASRPVILVADGEHHATIEAAEWLRDAQGAEVVWLPIDEVGVLQPETLEAAIASAGADRVALLSFLWANNEVGTVQPVSELCSIARDAGIPVHLDAVAALGQVPLDFAATGASLMSVSAHKIGGAVGVGALVVARDQVIDSLFHGGSQQRGRSGTQDVAGAVSFAAALDEIIEPGSQQPKSAHIEHLRLLRDRLIEGVRAVDPEAQLRGADPLESRLVGNAHFTFPGCQGDSLVYLLDATGVSASVGSACRAGVATISHVLLAMGVPEQEAAGALRFTLGSASTAADIDALLTALPAALQRARAAGLS